MENPRTRLLIPTSECKDIMVDIETTGTDPNRHAILQIAAMPFCVERMAYGDQVFNYSLAIPRTRSWQEDTRKWWYSNKEKAAVLAQITINQNPAAHVLHWFNDFALQMKENTRFWSNHPFDWGFLESYYRDFYEYDIPFKYYMFRDLESVIMGLAYPDIDNKYRIKKDKARAHDAIYDVEYQIECLFSAIESTRSTTNV